MDPLKFVRPLMDGIGDVMQENEINFISWMATYGKNPGECDFSTRVSIHDEDPHTVFDCIRDVLMNCQGITNNRKHKLDENHNDVFIPVLKTMLEGVVRAHNETHKHEDRIVRVPEEDNLLEEYMFADEYRNFTGKEPPEE